MHWHQKKWSVEGDFNRERSDEDLVRSSYHIQHNEGSHVLIIHKKGNETEQFYLCQLLDCPELLVAVYELFNLKRKPIDLRWLKTVTST